MQTVAGMLAKGWTMTGLAEALSVDTSTLYRNKGSEDKQLQLALLALSFLEDPYDYRSIHQSGEPGVYVIQCQDKVKIGYTACGPASRIQSLQIGNPFDLKLLLWLPGANEKAIQDRFSSARIRGEWFEFTPELRRWVEDDRGISPTPPEPSALGSHPRDPPP